MILRVALPRPRVNDRRCAASYSAVPMRGADHLFEPEEIFT